jgi:hypothetical protein
MATMLHSQYATAKLSKMSLSVLCAYGPCTVRSLALFTDKMRPAACERLQAQTMGLGALPNTHFTHGSAGGAPRNSLSGALSPRRSHQNVAPPGSARGVPVLPPGGHERGRRIGTRCGRQEMAQPASRDEVRSAGGGAAGGGDERSQRAGRGAASGWEEARQRE